jgi:hypothetical protein
MQEKGDEGMRGSIHPNTANWIQLEFLAGYPTGYYKVRIQSDGPGWVVYSKLVEFRNLWRKLPMISKKRMGELLSSLMNKAIFR